MNNTGLIQEHLMIIAIAATATLLVFSQTQANIQNQVTQSGAEIAGIALDQTNLLQVLDKTTSKHIADKIHATPGCPLPTSEFIGELQSKYQNDAAPYHLNNSCDAAVTNISTQSATVSVEVDLVCANQQNTTRTKKVITYQKTVSPVGTCNFVVSDTASGTKEYKCPSTGTCYPCTSASCP